jgi:hypothetical protein
MQYTKSSQGYYLFVPTSPPTKEALIKIRTAHTDLARLDRKKYIISGIEVDAIALNAAQKDLLEAFLTGSHIIGTLYKRSEHDPELFILHEGEIAHS